MADSKKYNGSTWEHSLRMITTATVTLTTLPADVYVDGNNATVGLKGNMSQTGTPTPTTPIQSSECGDRTGNLFDISTATLGKYIDNSGNEQSSSAASPTQRLNHSDYFSVSPNTTYTFSSVKDSAIQQTVAFVWYTSEKTFISRTVEVKPYETTAYSLTATAPNNAEYAIINYTTANNEVMLNTGSTALPYEPYGYKIPISSASTTTPVYLGEVETTRKIKKLVLTGNEQFYGVEVPSTNTMIFNFENLLNTAQFIPTVTSLSTHYVYNPIQSGMVVGLPINQYALQYYGVDNKYNLLIHDSICTSVSAFQTYLQQQYANGTPVTVWYVLSSATTGIVNEPLRKIGDYADTVNGVTIPTITGKDSFDVLTTLKPSEVDLTYTGWHDATVEEWDGTDWQ